MNTTAARLTGSVCFLVSSLLAVAAHERRARQPWRIAGLNLLGSIFFMAAAMAAARIDLS